MTRKIQKTDFEILLLENKFKQVWSDDKKEYWFIRYFDFPIYHQIEVQIDTRRKLMFLTVTGDDNDTATVEYTVKNWLDCYVKLINKDIIK